MPVFCQFEGKPVKLWAAVGGKEIKILNEFCIRSPTGRRGVLWLAGCLPAGFRRPQQIKVSGPLGHPSRGYGPQARGVGPSEPWKLDQTINLSERTRGGETYWDQAELRRRGQADRFY